MSQPRNDSRILVEFLATATLHVLFWMIGMVAGAVVGTGGFGLAYWLGASDPPAIFAGWIVGGIAFVVVLVQLYGWRRARRYSGED